jgi:hypothetical protein
MSATADGALTRIKGHLEPFEKGPLEKNVRAHYEHLQHLTASLRKIGIDDETIDQQVFEIFDSYKAELLRNIARIEAQSQFKSERPDPLRTQSNQPAGGHNE